MKKITLLSIIAATMLSFQGCDSKDKKEETPDRVYSMTTGLTTGTYYKEGQKIGEEMSKNGVSFKIVSSEGGEQNGRRVTKGVTDFGIIQKDTHTLLSTMDNKYTDNINVIATLGNEAVIFIVNKKSDIKSEKDIRENNVKIAISSKSSGAVSTLATMEKLDKQFSGKNVIYKDYDSALNELKIGTIDVVMMVMSNKVKNEKLNDTLKKYDLEMINIENKNLTENKLNGKKVYTECSMNVNSSTVKTICTEALIISNKKVEQNVNNKMIEVIGKMNF